jgi:hypothetical protein
MFVVFLNQMLLLQKLLGAWGSLVKGLNRKKHVVTVGISNTKTYGKQVSEFLLERIKLKQLNMAVFRVLALCNLVEVY